MNKLIAITLLNLCLSVQITSANSYNFYLPKHDVKIALTVRKEVRKNLVQVDAILTANSYELDKNDVINCLKLLQKNNAMLHEYHATIINFMKVRPQFIQDFIDAKKKTVRLINQLEQIL